MHFPHSLGVPWTDGRAHPAKNRATTSRRKENVSKCSSMPSKGLQLLPLYVRPLERHAGERARPRPQRHRLTRRCRVGRGAGAAARARWAAPHIRSPGRRAALPLVLSPPCWRVAAPSLPHLRLVTTPYTFTVTRLLVTCRELWYSSTEYGIGQ